MPGEHWQIAAAKAGAAIAARDWPLAERLLKRAAHRPGVPCQVAYNLAKVLVAGGKPQQAERWFRKALEQNPDYQAAWFEYGAWLIDARRYTASLEAFTRAAELDPGDMDAHRNRAYVAERLGRYGLALAAWEAILDRNGMDRAALLGRLRALLELRDSAADAFAEELLGRPELRADVIALMCRTSRGRLRLHVD